MSSILPVSVTLHPIKGLSLLEDSVATTTPTIDTIILPTNLCLTKDLRKNIHVAIGANYPLLLSSTTTINETITIEISKSKQFDPLAVYNVSVNDIYQLIKFTNLNYNFSLFNSSNSSSSPPSTIILTSTGNRTRDERRDIHTCLQECLGKGYMTGIDIHIEKK